MRAGRSPPLVMNDFFGKYNKFLIHGCRPAFMLLCVLHFFSERPLWLDENFVLASLHEFNYAQLFGVLKYEQAFPRIHLAIIKFIAAPFDFHVLALRCVSFFSMIGAFLIWRKIYTKEISFPGGIFICLLAFACSYRMVYYAAELKPYAMDVFAVGLFALFILRQKTITNKNITKLDYGAVILLPFLNLLGYAVFFIFWIVPYNFFLLIRKDKKFIPIFIISCVASLSSVVALYFTDIQFVLNSAARQGYWESYFICTESVGCFFSTFGEGSKRLVTFWFGNAKVFVHAAIIFIPFAFFALGKYGAGALMKNKGKVADLATIGFVLVVELFVFGLLHKYPFTGDRITLYLAPFFFFFIYKGLTSIPIKPVRWFFLGYYIVFCLACLCNTFVHYAQLY